MSKIKPMTLERLKEKLAEWNWSPESYAVEFEMALAWIETEARARMLEWAETHSNSAMHRLGCFERNASRNILEFEKHDWAKSDWIAAVKAEVGWVEDK